jgi:VWFA-related protein
MSRLSLWLIAAVLIRELPCSSRPVPSAQHRQTPPGGTSFRVDVNAVLLNVSVRDLSTNRTISNLRKEDFLVYEDGVLQQVEQLMQSDAPFSSLLLIDNSGSTRALLPLIKQAATGFTARLKDNDRVAIATFNSLVELIRDFTIDHPLAARAIGDISSIGGTALYDALMTCIDYYMRGVAERSAIVVFTDGVDNQLEGENTEGSRTPFSQLYRRIQEIDSLVYTIFLDTEGSIPNRRGKDLRRISPGIGWPIPQPNGRPAGQKTRWSDHEIHEKAREHLLAIAEQTGGRMYKLTKAEDLARVYSEIAEDLGIQYLLSYTPNGHTRDGMWHDIRIQLKNRSDAAIRTRKGYYAQKMPANPR